MTDYSQNGEQVHILHVFDVLGMEKGRLVDLGAGDGYTMSNTRALLNKGWEGVLVDGDTKGAADVHKLWITDRVVADLMILGIISIEFLNLDIDGNDYWVLRSILDSYSPILIVAEINPIFKRDEAVVMPYNEHHVWDGTRYYGMSLAACEMLAKEFGYTMIYLHAGINAFLLRNDHAAAHPELLRPIEYRQKFDHPDHPEGKPWTQLN